MDLMPILETAIRQTGGDPEKPTAEDLESAQKALRYVDRHVDEHLGYTHVASVTVSDHPIPEDAQ